MTVIFGWPSFSIKRTTGSADSALADGAAPETSGTTETQSDWERYEAILQQARGGILEQLLNGNGEYAYSNGFDLLVKRNHEDGTYYVNVLDENGNTLDGAGGFRYRMNALIKGADLLAKVATAEARGLPRGFVSMPEGPTPQPLFLRSTEQSAAPAAAGGGGSDDNGGGGGSGNPPPPPGGSGSSGSGWKPPPTDSTSPLDPTRQKGYDKEEIPNQERNENADTRENTGIRKPDALDELIDAYWYEDDETDNPATEGAGKTIVDNPFDNAGNLKSNVKYQSGEFNYNYETDTLGRLEKFQTEDLKLTERRSRLPHNPNTPGKLPGDHAGHLAGDRFGGSPDLDNLVSQSSDINLSQYKKIENQWANAIKNGKKVKVDVEVKYENDNSRPIRFTVKYEIDGKSYRKVLINQEESYEKSF